MREVLEAVAVRAEKAKKGAAADKAGKADKGKAKGKVGSMQADFASAAQLIQDYDRFNGIGQLSDLHTLRLPLLRLQVVTVKWWGSYIGACKRAAAKPKDLEGIAVAADREEWAASVLMAELLDVFEAHVERYENADRLCPPEVNAPAEQLTRLAAEVGFGDLATRMAAVWEERVGGTVAAGEDAAGVEAKVSRCSFNEFQLRVMAPRLPRPRNAPDPRTHGHFNPDTWQRELLDVVDNHESAIISAPTSSGKTFISYYAMEQVLSEPSKGDGVIVYIAPTKALVNQVEAEIYARFIKRYERPTRTLCGVFTHEYQHDVESCQILVALPSCLESLLVGSDRIKWARRLKWVVFDEVHCISSRGGEVWEHLLTLINCPFLALSATIGNPQQFQGWLRSLEEDRGRKLHVIVHKQRWNDLEPFVYDMDNNVLVRLNPVGLLNLEALANRGFPAEMKLLPEHCFQFHRELFAAVAGAADQGAMQPLFLELRRLDPVGDSADNFFVCNWRLTMTTASEYENRLKAVFVDLSRIDKPAAQGVIDAIGARFSAVIKVGPPRHGSLVVSQVACTMHSVLRWGLG